MTATTLMQTLLQAESRMLLYAFLISLITFGSADDSYFLLRKQMLQNANVTFYPQAKKSRTDKGHYADSTKPIVHNYKLIINEPDFCSKHHQVFLLILVRSFYSHLRWRMILREQLKHRNPLWDTMKLVVKYVFLFGSTTDRTVMKLIKDESNEYRDIIQEDFLESYINLTLKVPMGYKWVLNYCPNAEYIMVSNDELSYDVDKIVSFLFKDYSMGRYDDHFAICYLIGNSPAKHKGIPQFQKMDKKVLYRGDFYPPYCHGYGYAAHIQVINKLYRATIRTPPFMPTDVWIGIMSEKLRLQTPDTQQLYILEKLEAYHAKPDYPVLPGAIAVCDFDAYKGHEFETLQAVIKSMRNHWAKNQYLRDYFFQFQKEDSTDINRYMFILVCVTLIVIIFKRCLINLLQKSKNLLLCLNNE